MKSPSADTIEGVAWPIPPLTGGGTRKPRQTRSAKLALGAMALVGLVGGWSTGSGASNLSSAKLVTRSGTVRVIPAPIGYQVETQSGTTNGPISRSAFDAEVGSGSTTSFGFVKGYDITYGSTATSESVEVTLFVFHSPSGAAAFNNAAMTFWGASGLAPATKAIRSIPGSTVQIATKPGSDGFYLVDAFARKGDESVVVEYANTVKPNGVPQPLKAALVSQYSRL